MSLNNLRKRVLYTLLATIFLFTSTKNFAQQKEQLLHNLNKLLVNTVMEDLFTPPIASRIYVYPNIAFYECIRLDDPSLPTLTGKLNGLKTLPALPANKKVDNFIAACASFSYVAQTLVGTEYKIENWRTAFTDSLMRQGDTMVIKNSVQYGRLVADSIIAWTKRDNYLKSRGLMRYVISHKPGDWQPTPLDYAQGLEPHWNTIRPLTLSSPSQFSPKEKLVYSMDKKSMFYKTMMECYNIVNNLDSVRKATALYWDDNPNVSANIGHLNYFIHKISPGGHWVMIAGQACAEKNISVTKSAQVYALTTVAIFDAFISCWDEKYKINLIRPITIINRNVDRNWVPFIQTPPFPEFTSGHSVTSNAASTILTALLGDNYVFTDKTEIPFGQGTRTFNSFYEASLESSTSRVYGGIHYPETARISVLQGKAIGKNVLQILYPAAIVK
ncbi:vanadium-dependent haloperoxidase [Ferruginibacter sp. SUN106]|uniref:vanadium-dependent haloperoxidase n=1 Tax=Ferruginibacter sp. SUN106 TaxID=2978348 RepID=UPI003D36ED8C